MKERPEKVEKSPLLVTATIMFLAMFIIVPPLLRKTMPKEDDGSDFVLVKKNLYCEKTSAKEKKKVTAAVFYENDVAVKNKMTFMDYTPRDGEKDTGSGIMTIENEALMLQSMVSVDVEESDGQTVVILTQQTIIDNSMNPNVLYKPVSMLSRVTFNKDCLDFPCSSNIFSTNFIKSIILISSKSFNIY